MLELVDSAVADLMSRDVITVLEDATLGDAAELMIGFGISGLPVVDDDGCLVGVLSETDLIRVRGAAPPWRRWHTIRVRDLMTAPPVVVGASVSVAEAARLMADRRIHRVFVVDTDDMPIGVLSESDVVAQIADMDD